tara:strand:+ start:2477 stop:3391 length:915 start_codon:yes stop_codon:yes gene_type:complete
MFTQNTMKLTKLNHLNLDENFEIVRDCEFAYLGKLKTNLNPRLVACSNEEHISLLSKYEGISGVITTNSLKKKVQSNFGLIISSNPLKLLYSVQKKISNLDDFQWKNFPTIIGSSSFIHPSSSISKENVIIGDSVFIGPGCVVKDKTIIGDNTNIYENTVLGCEAFEVDKSRETRELISQSGGVKVGSNVDILSSCSIARSTFGGFTEIGDYSKIDCQTHVGHDCKIGKNTVVAPSVTISGRVVLGEDVYIGPNATITNGVNIMDGAFVSLGSVVIGDVTAGKRVSGNYAIDHMKWLKMIGKEK